MRILAMDVGDRRIGIAVSDEMGLTAQGIGTLIRKNNVEDIKKLREIVMQYFPQKIVLGMPKNMDGSIGQQGNKVIEFAEFLKTGNIFAGEIVYWDERLTSVSSQKILIEANMKRSKRKKHIDQMSAVLILQGYLEFLRNRKER